MRLDDLRTGTEPEWRRDYAGGRSGGAERASRRRSGDEERASGGPIRGPRNASRVDGQQLAAFTIAPTAPVALDAEELTHHVSGDVWCFEVAWNPSV